MHLHISTLAYSASGWINVTIYNYQSIEFKLNLLFGIAFGYLSWYIAEWKKRKSRFYVSVGHLISSR